MAGKEAERQKERKSSEKKEDKKEQKGKETGSGYTVPIAIVVAVVAIAIILGYIASSNLIKGGGSTFAGFQSSFYSAHRVAIYVPFINSSDFSYTTTCAAAVIETITGSKTHNRNSSTIDYFVIANSTSCLAPAGSLGHSNGTRVVPISSCIAISKTEPSVFLNYSIVNSTTVRDGNLYTQGDGLFLQECGIAAELG